MNPRTLPDLLDTIDGVDGWLSSDQAERLYEAATATRRGDQIVEIGSFRGRSTIVLAGAAPDGVAIVAIDPHAGNDRGPQEITGFAVEAASDHEVFTANLAARGSPTECIMFVSSAIERMPTSRDPSPCCTSTARTAMRPALSDIRSWGARVEPGGTMLIHDSFSSVGVTLAIVSGADVRPAIPLCRPVAFAERVPRRPRPPATASVNAVRQIAQLPWFIKNLGLKVLLSLGWGKLVRRLGLREPEWPY